jgi:PilZ domain
MKDKKELDAKDLIFDIRCGMTDSQLMDKYRLSYKGLQSALKKLIGVQAISAEELLECFPLYEQMTVDDLQKIATSPIPHPVPIYESNDSDVVGQIRYLTERGVGIEGMAIRVGEIKTLVIDAHEYLPAEPFQFDAQCRWVRKKSTGEYFAGLEIMKISDKAMEELEYLTRMFGQGD